MFNRDTRGGLFQQTIVAIGRTTPPNWDLAYVVVWLMHSPLILPALQHSASPIGSCLCTLARVGHIAGPFARYAHIVVFSAALRWLLTSSARVLLGGAKRVATASLCEEEVPRDIFLRSFSSALGMQVRFRILRPPLAPLY